MNASWYCQDCEEQIEAEDRDEHEADGHEVRGRLRPNRLLGNDPWNMEVRDGPELDDGEVSE